MTITLALSSVPKQANKIPDLLMTLPVVVCVAMYHLNGALEANVNLIGRTEGVDLWHFS